jgi:hypothetical protein
MQPRFVVAGKLNQKCKDVVLRLGGEPLQALPHGRDRSAVVVLAGALHIAERVP